MQKTLTTAGNSVALVIEKPIQHLLGLHRDQRVWVRIDGRKLIIEAVTDEVGDPTYCEPAEMSPPIMRPSPPPPPRRKQRFDPNAPTDPLAGLCEGERWIALRVYHLANGFGLTTKQLDRLVTDGGSPFGFTTKVQSGWMTKTANPEIKANRVELCLDLRRDGSDWSAALDEVDRVFPLPTAPVAP